MRLLEALAQSDEGHELDALAASLGCDDRTLRRDVDYLHELLSRVRGVEIRRGRVIARRGPTPAGYFADHLGDRIEQKKAIARAVAGGLQDDLAVVLTAGTTNYYVACEIRRRLFETERPRNLIVFTNSLPALLELTAAGVATGVVGEVYNEDDCAFHSHEYRSAFHPMVAIVGASGLVADANTGALELYSHRAEEALFLRQLIEPVPEIVVATSPDKIGRRHPWCFTSPALLRGKALRLVTCALDDAGRERLAAFTASAKRVGTDFRVEEADPARGGA